MNMLIPGPWFVPDDDRPHRVLADDDRRTVICEMAGGRSNDAYTQCARLIAAAPDMYALLVRVAEICEDTDAPMGIASRAILARIDGDES